MRLVGNFLIVSGIIIALIVLFSWAKLWLLVIAGLYIWVGFLCRGRLYYYKEHKRRS